MEILDWRRLAHLAGVFERHSLHRLLGLTDLSRGGVGCHAFRPGTFRYRRQAPSVLGSRDQILCERGADRWQEIVVLSSLERGAS